MNYCIYCMEQIEGNPSVCVKCKMAQNYKCPVHHLKPGTVLLGRYLLGKALGEGGFGITYIGRDLNLDMRVAIKEYYPSGFSTRNHKYSNTVTLTQTGNSDGYEKEMQRFLHEAQTLAKFNDELGIVGVRDFFRENGTAYIVMDFLDGITLKKYIQQKGPMSAGKVFELMDPMMQALSRIHSQGLIHRDISPDNIMMLKNGMVKLLDFGAARDVTADKSLSVVLKPGYAPEEQYRTKGEQGPWTDVYALCATMYKCITGITPDESLERAYDDNLKAPSDLGISIKPEQEKVLLQGLRVRCSERIQDMDTLRQDLMTADDKELTHRVLGKRQPEDEVAKTVYQSPATGTYVLPATAMDETEKTIYQPQQPVEKEPSESAAELLTTDKKKLGRKKKKLNAKELESENAKGRRVARLVSLLFALCIPLLVFAISGVKKDPCADGHLWKVATCEYPETCENCGATQGLPADHKWINATCETPQICQICNLVEGEQLNHQWKEATCVEAKTCELCNITEGDALGHTFYPLTDTFAQTHEGWTISTAADGGKQFEWCCTSCNEITDTLPVSYNLSASSDVVSNGYFAFSPQEFIGDLVRKYSGIVNILNIGVSDAETFLLMLPLNHPRFKSNTSMNDMLETSPHFIFLDHEFETLHSSQFESKNCRGIMLVIRGQEDIPALCNSLVIHTISACTPFDEMTAFAILNQLSDSLDSSNSSKASLDNLDIWAWKEETGITLGVIPTQ